MPTRFYAGMTPLRSLLKFGAPFEEVHRWLDAFAGTPEYGMRHRRVRHHAAGIREAVRLFGADVYKPARQHIVSDLNAGSARNPIQSLTEAQSAQSLLNTSVDSVPL